MLPFAKLTASVSRTNHMQGGFQETVNGVRFNGLFGLGKILEDCELSSLLRIFCFGNDSKNGHRRRHRHQHQQLS